MARRSHRSRRSNAIIAALVMLASATLFHCSEDSSDDPNIPDVAVPDVVQPDATQPDATQLDVAVPDVAVPDVAVLDAAVPDAAQPDHGWPVASTWVTIPAGTFTMGSPASEPCRESNEEQHQVTLTHGFEIQTTEVTQGQFQSVMGYNPAIFQLGEIWPAEKVNWHEAAAYCNALSSQKPLAQCYNCLGSGASVTCSEAAAYSGQDVYSCPGYRLPTEAEWEYAYRAGTTTAFYSGEILSCSTDANADKIGWYESNSIYTNSVGQKQANAWGLYDMAGNVWEWCHDLYQDSLGSSTVTNPVGSGANPRVVRGGSWDFYSFHLRAAYRGHANPTDRSYRTGFRCSRTL